MAADLLKRNTAARHSYWIEVGRLHRPAGRDAEPPRVCRRAFGLSYSAMAGTSGMASRRSWASAEEVWVIGEHRSTGERKYYLSNLPAKTPLKQLAGAIKAHYAKKARQQLKEELGLDHFEGRSWIGLRRHVLMTMIA